MIKFFRQIRFKLMKQNKTSRYFKYAIGEIILVVIGILIALQINNWNQERLDTIDKNKLIENLNVEFLENKKQLEEIVNSYASCKNASVNLQTYIGNNKGFNKRVIDSLIDGVFPIVDYMPSDNAINSIVQSGKLNLLENTPISKKLSDWKSKIHIIKSREEKLEIWIFNNLIPYLNKYISWRDVGVAGNYNWATPSALKTDYEHIFNDLEFENILENHIYFVDQSLKRNKEAYDLIEEIIDLTSQND